MSAEHRVRPPPVRRRHRQALRRRHAHRHDHRVRLPDGGARGRGGDPADPRRRLARAGDAGLRHDRPRDDGRDAPPHEGRGAGHEAGADRRRHAVPLVQHARRGRRTTRAGSCARAATQAVKVEGGVRSRAGDRGDRQGRHPGHGPHRADAAGDQRDRPGPRPGQEQGPGAVAARRRARGPGGGGVRDRARARPGPARRGDHPAAADPDDRDRGGRRLLGPDPGHHRHPGLGRLDAEARPQVRRPPRRRSSRRSSRTARTSRRARSRARPRPC